MTDAGFSKNQREQLVGMAMVNLQWTVLHILLFGDCVLTIMHNKVMWLGNVYIKHPWSWGSWVEASRLLGKSSVLAPLTLGH